MSIGAPLNFYNGFFVPSFGQIFAGDLAAGARRERRGVFEKRKAEQHEYLFVDKSSDREH